MQNNKFIYGHIIGTYPEGGLKGVGWKQSSLWPKLGFYMNTTIML